MRLHSLNVKLFISLCWRKKQPVELPKMLVFSGPTLFLSSVKRYSKDNFVYFCFDVPGMCLYYHLLHDIIKLRSQKNLQYESKQLEF